MFIWTLRWVIENGISTVREIKKISPETMVIYVTFHEVYFTQMFETEPFRYLGKPLEEESFNRYLEDALKRIRERLCYYTYTTGHITCRVPVRDIFYFESRRRKIIRGREDIFYGRLGEIQKELEKGGRPFIRIHQSYLVNPYEINRYYPDRVEMVGKMLSSYQREQTERGERKVPFISERINKNVIKFDKTGISVITYATVCSTEMPVSGFGTDITGYF